MSWSKWLPFPDPRKGGYLHAPFGPGAYELRNRQTDEYVLFGNSENVAYRMSSLLPAPLGTGTRTNEDKKQYVLENIADVEYRTLACETKEQAEQEERVLKNSGKRYIFNR